jgi:p38 MAP kinase
MNQGWVVTEINNGEWRVPNRYSDLTPLGQGAYGLVCSALDSVSNTRVAIKKLSRPFATNIHARRAYREIKLLKHVRHDNLICLLDLFSHANQAMQLDDIYLTTNLMGTDLNNVLRTQTLADDQIVFFTYQILRGLKYLHSSNIIHRDLKPGNLTVNENCELRIIDFGLARGEREEMTGYVATRWYRAPEIMLRWMHYTKAVDIWSVGCILAEMYLQRPLFPGSDHVNQLNRILEVAGFPSPTLLAQVNEDARSYLERNQRKPRVNFSEYFSEIKSHTAIDLIDKMLQLDPNERINCEQALAHPYLARFHDEDDEPKGVEFVDLDEAQEFTVDEWKSIII